MDIHFYINHLRIYIYIYYNRKYICNICNKQYSSYKSLWNHNKIFYNIISTKNTQNTTNIPHITTEITQLNTKNIFCNYCKKNFSRNDSLKRYKKICKNKKSFIEEYKLIKQELNNIKKQLAIFINKEAKIHPKTLQKLINTNNILTNNSNNTINNNITIKLVKFGNEDLEKVLNKKDMSEIINKVCLCI